MRKVDKDPFSNGTEYDLFVAACCDHCVKHSHLKREGDSQWEDEYTKVRCSIERDILSRMWCNEPVNERTIRVCNDFTLKGILCPFMRTEGPKRKRTPKEQLTFQFKEE